MNSDETSPTKVQILIIIFLSHFLDDMFACFVWLIRQPETDTDLDFSVAISARGLIKFRAHIKISVDFVLRRIIQQRPFDGGT
jgi:hypothetical protein